MEINLSVLFPNKQIGVGSGHPLADRRVIPAARKTDSLFEWRAAGIVLILRAAATPTLRAYQSAPGAAGISPISLAWLHVADRCRVSDRR
jgi:hypothetical protein